MSMQPVLYIVEMGFLSGGRAKLCWAGSLADANRIVEHMKERDRKRSNGLEDCYYEITSLADNPWPETPLMGGRREEYDEDLAAADREVEEALQ